MSNSCQFASDPLSSVSEVILCTESDMFHLLCAVGYMLKGTAESIASSLAHLFNMSIKFGKVPAAWKVSQFQKRPTVLMILHIIDQFHYFHYFH